MRLRLVLSLVLAALCVAALPSPAHAQSSPDRAPRLNARSAIVMEASTGDILYTKRAYSRRAIASTTKLMTVLVTLRRADLDDIYSAAPYAAQAAESQIGLRAGEKLSVRDLLRATLLPSANDAANTLAVGTLGSRRAFVREMNRQAQRLGLRDTHYANPVGLDQEGNYSSARDLAKLAIALRKNEFFRRTVALPRVTLRTGARPRTVLNRNTLVGDGKANGVKTGRTSRAGYVLVGSESRDDVTVVSVVLGDPDEATRDADSAALLRYGLSSYRKSTLLPQGRRLGRIELKYRDETVDAVAGATVSRVLRRGQRATVSVLGLPQETDGPRPRGSRVGTAVVRSGGKVVGRVPVVTAKPVSEAGLGTRLEDLASKPLTLVALVLLLVCSLPLLLLRRRALLRQRSLDAERRRAHRSEETPVA